MLDFEGLAIQAVEVDVPGLGLTPLTVSEDKVALRPGDRLVYSVAGVVEAVHIREPRDRLGFGKGLLTRAYKLRLIAGSLEIVEVITAAAADVPIA